MNDKQIKYYNAGTDLPTKEQVKTLLAEAQTAGDYVTQRACEAFIRGESGACERIICDVLNDALAQQ